MRRDGLHTRLLGFSDAAEYTQRYKLVESLVRQRCGRWWCLLHISIRSSRWSSPLIEEEASSSPALSGEPGEDDAGLGEQRRPRQPPHLLVGIKRKLIQHLYKCVLVRDSLAPPAARMLEREREGERSSR